MASWLDGNPVSYVLTLLLGGSGMWAVLQSLAAARATTKAAEIKEPADLLTAMAAFQGALNKQAEGLTGELKAVIDRLQADLDRMEHEADEMRDRIADLERENQQCRGENRQMGQRIVSLEAFLRSRGIDIPTASDTLVTIEGDNVTVFPPEKAAG